MTKKQKREKIAKVVLALKELYPDAACSLEYEGDGWRLLVMGRLSAQCTDERVNIVCRELFAKMPTARDMANAELSEFRGVLDEYALNPEVVKTRIYADKISRAISSIGTIRVVQDGETNIIIGGDK